MVVAPISVRMTLKRPADLESGVADTGVVQSIQQGGICGKTGYHRHQVRFTGAVITDHQYPLVVDRMIELHMRDDKQRESRSAISSEMT